MNQVSSIAVIGGADGPTSIFVASALSRPLLLGAVFLLLVGGGVLALWFSRR